MTGLMQGRLAPGQRAETGTWTATLMIDESSVLTY